MGCLNDADYRSFAGRLQAHFVAHFVVHAAVLSRVVRPYRNHACYASAARRPVVARQQ